MGISKWIMTHSPGSVGALTRNWSKIYVDNLKQYSKDNAIIKTYENFIISTHSNNTNRRIIDYDLYVSFASPCVSAFMFMLTFDFSDDMRKALMMGGSMLEDSLDVIYTQSVKEAPQLISFNLSQFKIYAKDYIIDYITYNS